MGDRLNRKVKKKNNKITNEQRKSLYIMLGSCLVLIIISFLLAFFTQPPGTDGVKKTVAQFIGFSTEFGIKQIMVGLVSSIVFGIVDNGGLFFGMDALDPFLWGNELEKAGLGNTFSDFLGAFLGTFIGIFIENISGVNESPLYTDALGIVIGCLVGLYGAKAITGK